MTDKPIAHSKSEYRRLTAQGVDVRPPTDKPVEPLSAKQAKSLLNLVAAPDMDGAVQIIGDFTTEISALGAVFRGQHTVIAMSPDEFAALKRDAERWRHCEKNGLPIDNAVKGGVATFWGSYSGKSNGAEGIYGYGSTPAEAIDAAIAKEQRE